MFDKRLVTKMSQIRANRLFAWFRIPGGSPLHPEENANRHMRAGWSIQCCTFRPVATLSYASLHEFPDTRAA